MVKAGAALPAAAAAPPHRCDGRRVCGNFAAAAAADAPEAPRPRPIESHRDAYAALADASSFFLPSPCARNRWSGRRSVPRRKRTATKKKAVSELYEM